MNKGELLLKVNEIMQKHIGRRNSISAGRIAEMLGLKEEDTHVEPRKYLRQCIEELKVPLGAGPKGFYIIADKGELDRYIQELDNRIKGIKKRKKEVIDAFNDYYR